MNRQSADNFHLQEWEQVSSWQIIFVTTAVLFVIGFSHFSESEYIPILDSANLAFHEAGHVIFGIFGPTLGLYGGTLGQLVFPIAVSVRFWRIGDGFACSLGLIWLFENFLNIARYMADARAQALPLVGGGQHDWTNILSRWGMLEADQTLAGFVRFVAVSGMLGTWFWLYLAYLRSKRSLFS